MPYVKDPNSDEFIWVEDAPPEAPPVWTGGRPPLTTTPPFQGNTPPWPARPGYQWVKNPTTGEWEEHSTVPEVPDGRKPPR